MVYFIYIIYGVPYLNLVFSTIHESLCLHDVLSSITACHLHIQASEHEEISYPSDDRPIAVRQAQCEAQIFTYLTLGYALKTIVKTLGISPHTEWSIERLNVLTYELYV